MDGQSRLYAIALGVAIFVILGITICFSVLFFLYSFYKRKNIRGGLEDDKIIYDLISGYEKANKHRKKEEKLTCEEYFEYDRRRIRRLHNISDTISGIIIVFFTILLAIGLSFNLTKNQLYIGGSTYLAIMSGSMETVTPENTYVGENDLTDQITQYSLIKIDRINSEEDLKQYDVIAFKNSKDEIIVHRIISIYDGKDDNNEETLEGTTYYMTRGDANIGSYDYEAAITYDQIIGVYHGKSNYICGVFIIYFKSTLGIISLFFAAVFLFLATWAEELITKEYNKRAWYLFNNDEICKQYAKNLHKTPLTYKGIKELRNKNKGLGNINVTTTSTRAYGIGGPYRIVQYINTYGVKTVKKEPIEGKK